MIFIHFIAFSPFLSFFFIFNFKHKIFLSFFKNIIIKFILINKLFDFNNLPDCLIDNERRKLHMKSL